MTRTPKSPFGTAVDFEEELRSRATALGSRIAEQGPSAILDEIEELVPDQVRDTVQSFPLLALGLSVGVGVWLGMKKSEDIIAAGSTILTTAAMASVAEVVEKSRGANDEG